MRLLDIQDQEIRIRSLASPPGSTPRRTGIEGRLHRAPSAPTAVQGGQRLAGPRPTTSRRPCSAILRRLYGHARRRHSNRRRLSPGERRVLYLTIYSTNSARCNSTNGRRHIASLCDVVPRTPSVYFTTKRSALKRSRVFLTYDRVVLREAPARTHTAVPAPFGFPRAGDG